MIKSIEIKNMVNNDVLKKALSEMEVELIKEEEIVKEKNRIGQGANSKVYKGIYKDVEVAMKKLKNLKDETEEDNQKFGEIVNEIRCSQHAKCDYVPKFFGVYKRKNKFFLIFEFIQGKTLKEIYSSLNYKQKLDIIYNLSKILISIHSFRIIHRDIKPSNVMVSNDNKVRLIDFGVSKITELSKTFTGTSAGTTRYTAPECFNLNNDQSFSITNKIDIWSTGCLISEIFSGVIPWMNKVKNEIQVMSKLVKNEEFPIPVDKIESASIVSLIRKCTVNNPVNRICAEQLMKEVLSLMESVENI